jgi:hypothetical protein
MAPLIPLLKGGSAPLQHEPLHAAWSSKVAILTFVSSRIGASSFHPRSKIRASCFGVAHLLAPLGIPSGRPRATMLLLLLGKDRRAMTFLRSGQ